MKKNLILSCFMLKTMKRFNTKGFTLMEVIISLSLMSFVFLMLLSGLFLAKQMNRNREIKQKVAYEERYLTLFFQKQILKSEKIVLKSNRVYLQDLESPEQYYNYYESSQGMLRRYKVNAIDFRLIGSGNNSQFGSDINNFSLKMEGEKMICLRYEMVVGKKTIKKNLRIQHARPIDYYQ